MRTEQLPLAPQRARSEVRPAGWRRWPVVLVALVLLILLLDVAAIHLTVTPNSDGASQVLEGLSVVHGNLLLHGWSLSLDSFWTSEVPFYAAALLLVGFHGVLILSVVPAVEAALVVAVAMLAATEGRRGAAAAAAGVTVVAMLALPSTALAQFFLQGGSHIGAILWSLIAFYALRRGRWGAGVGVAAFVLTVGMLGDLQTLAYGTGPVAAAGLVAMLRRRSLAAGLPAVAAAAGAGVATVVVREVAAAAGAFLVGKANPFAPIHQIPANIKGIWLYGGELIGLHHGVYGTGGAPVWLTDVRVAGGVVVLAALLLAVVRLVAGILVGTPETSGGAERPGLPPEAAGPGRYRRAGRRGDDARWWQSEAGSFRLDDMLLLGAGGVVASYVALAYLSASVFGRYLTAAAVFLIVLAARTLARAWQRSRVPRLRAGTFAAGVVLAALFAAGFGSMVTTTPGPPRPAATLGHWLAAHHLTSGIGEYWSSNITTVESDGHVRVRPVLYKGGRLYRYGRESSAAWYAGQEFDFAVYRPGAPWGGISEKSLTRALGAPQRVYFVDGTYLVMVWAHPFSVPPSPMSPKP